MKKILFIEDDSLIIKIYSTRLAKDNYKVISASSGDEGLKKAREEMPDLVLLDLMLPKVSGLEILQSLKKDPKTSKIPVIVYTNLAREEEIKKAKELGAAAFFPKADFTPAQVIAEIKRHLN